MRMDSERLSGLAVAMTVNGRRPIGSQGGKWKD